MAQIRKIIHKEMDLTIFTVSGQIVIEQMINTLEEFYNSNFTKNALWDFSKADYSTIKEDQREKMISITKKNGGLRMKKGGKTAIVVADDLSYGLARMYEAYCEIADYNMQLSIFRKFDEALNYFKNKNP